MLKVSTLPIVRFSVEHPWIIIAASLIITVTLALPLQRLQIEPDVESLLPDELMVEEGGQQIETKGYDKLLIMVSGDNLFTLKALQNFQSTYRKLQSSLPVKTIIDPFSQTSLEKEGSRLTAVTLAPDGIAPESENDLKIFRKRLTESRFAPGLISSRNGPATA